MRKSDQLKVIGLTIMIIDHIALFLFGGVGWLFAIARFIGFPFFAYGVGMGALHTSRPGRYLSRLFLFAVACQPFFMLATGSNRGNIVFALFLGALAVVSWRFLADPWRWCVPAFIVCLGGTWAVPFVGYGAYGVGMILSFALGPVAACLYQGVASVYFLSISDVQWLAVFSLLFVYVLPVPKVTFPRWFYYVSYPGHLAAIAAVKIFVPF